MSLAATARSAFRQLSRPGRAVSQRVVHAGFWSLAARGSTRLLGVVRTVVLARLLAPDDFGLFGIALVVLSFLINFSNTGLQAAVIQKKGDVADYLDTVWTVHLLRGAALGAVLIITAPLIAQFFGESAATPLLRVLGISIFLQFLANPGTLHYLRELELRKQFVLLVSGNGADFLVAVIGAIVLRSAWALMLGLLANKVVVLVLSYAMHPYRPRFRLRWTQVRELSGFGRWVFLTNLLLFLAYRGDSAIIGKFLGPAALGTYMLTLTIAEIATVEFSRVIGEVTFPLYARVQDQLEKVRRAYVISVDVIASGTIPVAVLLGVVAEPLVRVALGDRWLAVAPLLAPVALSGAIRGVVMNGGFALLQGVGRSDLNFYLHLFSVGVTYALVFPLLRAFGLIGVAFAVLAGMLATVPVLAWQTRRVLRIDFAAQARLLLPSLALASAVGVASFFAVRALSQTASFSRLAAGSAVALAAYALAAWLLWRLLQVGPLRVVPVLAGRQTSMAPPPTSPSASG